MSSDIQHPLVSDDTRISPNQATSSDKHENESEDLSVKARKRDVVKSVFTLGVPISINPQNTLDQGERKVHDEYKNLALKDNREELDRRQKATLVLQKYYRGHLDRKRVNAMRLQRDARWDDLVKQTREATYAKGQLDNKNDVKSRWHRAVQAASRLERGQGVYSAPTYLTEEIPGNQLSEKTRKSRRATFWGTLSMGIGKDRNENETLPFHSKALEQQHWLEMIDGKHRYGSNMKYYFRKWKEAETQDNFFRWLDRGDGKDLDLEELPRERLEKERITYLSAEQRLNYLIKVDKDGLLRWAKSNELVDTAAGKWKDAGDGNGIIPEDDQSDDEDEGQNHRIHGLGLKTKKEDPYATTSKTPLKSSTNTASSSTTSLSSDSYSAESDLDDNEDTHYAGLDKDDEEKNWLKAKRKRLTPGGMRKELLRKTVRRNTWIYVSDMKLNLFIGIKQSGTFQHSSFLAGGKVTSAGIIVVKHGLIKSLNPLSGHYRSSIEHFRAFIGQLEDRGVDLSHIKIAKSVLSLWGLSKYAEITKKEQSMISHIKKALHLKHEPTEEEKSAELKANAEREEEQHQERMRRIHTAENESGLKAKSLHQDNHLETNQVICKNGGVNINTDQIGDANKSENENENDEKIRQVRRQVLYGKQNDQKM
ncbi:uncharacterized protein L201_002694 [Kwoniella dendrophila CBS 6074]|uniref:IQ domain-containing calmodulin-binding protein n=1 Tax=Kwoniella dendrophila CBS 6074 TaxID=1295534 RepID=A0AAX4JQV0_9TREE